MAILTDVREVCDVCRNPRRKVTLYRVGRDGLLVKVVLCREHGKYLEELIAIGSVVPDTAPKAKLWTIEEIEERKKKTPPDP